MGRLARALPLAVAALAATGPAHAGELRDPSPLRVRVLESAAPVELRGAEGALHRVEVPAAAPGLRVDGAPAPPRWRPPGRGPWRVGDGHYRGGIEILRHGEHLEVVNEIPLEVYVAGTLLGEVSEGWGDAALRALAVAVRTYAVHRAVRARRAGLDHDLEADTRGQRYLGHEAEHPRAWAAVRATAGQVLVWDGRPILAVHHADAGGRTASAEEVWGRPVPYLTSVAVPGAARSPETYWRVRLDPAMLARAAGPDRARLGRIRDLRILGLTPSGRVARVRLVGERGAVERTGRELREAIGPQVVRSTFFRVRREGGSIVLVGSGYGHGVGLSQWGARAMAEEGATYTDILGHFYPGARLARLGPGAPASLPHARAGEDR